MARATDGGPAFPVPGVYGDENIGHQQLERGEEGMTLRDYFAASALAGTLAGRMPGTNATPKTMAEFAYRCADAMIAARDKPTEPDRPKQ